MRSYIQLWVKSSLRELRIVNMVFIWFGLKNEYHNDYIDHIYVDMWCGYLIFTSESIFGKYL